MIGRRSYAAGRGGFIAVVSEKEILESDATAATPGQTGPGTMAGTRQRLPGAGGYGTEQPTTGMFCLDFCNRRGLGGRTDRNPVPRSSGALGHDLGFPECREGRSPLHTQRGPRAVHPLLRPALLAGALTFRLMLHSHFNLQGAAGNAAGYRVLFWLRSQRLRLTCLHCREHRNAVAQDQA